MTTISLDPRAYALRPVRIVGEELRLYEATTFPHDPYRGCKLWLRRCAALGFLEDDGSTLIIDVLDENGDIIQDFPVTRKGFEYLRRTLKFRVER